MGLIKEIFTRHQKKVHDRNNACDELILRVDDALTDAESMFSDPVIFVDPTEENLWRERNSMVFSSLETTDILRLKKAAQFKFLTAKKNDLFIVARSMLNRIIQHNEQAAKKRIPTAYSLIGDVEGRKLDNQQMMCIVKEAHNHLVIAGAGTGKTTTIVGKIKYLLRTEKFQPQDILVLSFTNASANEMKDRIAKETGYNIAASTFHKLGLNIISEVNGVLPKITQLNLRKFINDQLQLNMKSDKYFYLLSEYLLYNRVASKSEFAFSSEKEYEEYLRLNPPTTVKKEKVKSYGEMDIANFLTQNNINYIYEYPYEADTRTNIYAQYYPDFYLPDYKIYIEYFGIDRNGEVPSYFKSKNGISATKAYCASMEWKRNLHRQHKTTMIECYAYERLEGDLLDLLKEKLEAASVKLVPKSSKELWAQISGGSNSLLNGVIELFETLINLIKSNGYDIDAVRKLNGVGENKYTNNILLLLLEPIFNAYEQYLLQNKEIDFNDMINLSTEFVRQGKYINPYKYVIIDEYQDISKARFKLLDCLRESNDYDIFCVGDDWQSIYRFAGSDIGFILNFSKFWGSSEISKIETTYRFSQKLIEISGRFIMNNPAQIRKIIKGKSETDGFPLGEISCYNDYLTAEYLSEALYDIPKENDIFFIGRYSFDINPLKDSGLFRCSYDKTSGFINVKSTVRPDLKITFLTAHKSKGLQADYVFIINNLNSRMGFPSKIQDAPILDLLLENNDRYPFAEERRLFYVAFTRAKKKVLLLTVKNKESEFANEIIKRYSKELKNRKYECPLCGGSLIKISGQYGDFFGCSNYRKNGCTYKRKIN